jgi:hypothetical protein
MISSQVHLYNAERFAVGGKVHVQKGSTAGELMVVEYKASLV